MLSSCGNETDAHRPTETGQSQDLESVLGRDAEVCTTPGTGDVFINDIVQTRGDTVTVGDVSLRSADNLTPVETRVVPVSSGGSTRSPVSTGAWPLTGEWAWWWDRAGTQRGPLSGDILVMVRLTRPDPARDGHADAIQIAYEVGSDTRVLDNNYELRVSTTCPTAPTGTDAHSAGRATLRASQAVPTKSPVPSATKSRTMPTSRTTTRTRMPVPTMPRTRPMTAC